MRIVSIVLMAVAMSCAGAVGASIRNTTPVSVVAGCDDPNQIYLDGCCVTLAHVYQWGAECDYIICSPSDPINACTNSCCDGDVWITQDGCAPCVFV